MRQILLALVFLASSFFLMTSCQRDNALRVVGLPTPFYADLIDRGIERDPETGEPEEIEVVPDDVATGEFQYVEIGPGLPTWTPYQAHIEQVRIKFSRKMGDELAEPLPDIVVPCKFVVPSDPTGKKKVSASFHVLPSWYKDEYLMGYDYIILEATLTFTGYDDASGRDITAQNKMEVVVSDFYDDPTRIGQ